MNIWSALLSFEQWALKWHLEPFELLLSTNGNKAERILDRIMDAWFNHVLILDIVHPIILTDASILAWDGKSLHEVPSARLIIDKLGAAKTWVDVINAKHAETMLSRTVEHYAATIGKSFGQLLRDLR